MLRLVVCLFLILSFSSIGYSKTFYGDADSRAYRVPEKYLNNLDSLTNYLIEPYKNNEELKARVIFAFIVYHIQYDMYEYESGYEWSRKKAPISSHKDAENKISNFKQTPQETLKTRRGVCRHLTNLYLHMAKKAGLKAVEIEGLAEGSPHAWNGVKINKKWHLLDVTWGGGNASLQGIKNDKDYKRALKIREKKIKSGRIKNSKKIRNEWFLSDPKKFFKTHHPYDLKWSLLPNHQKANDKLP